MAHIIKRRQALKLRKEGLSYSQIKKKLNLSKSTLSLWLRDYPLSKERVHELQHGEARIEKYRQTMREKREKRFKQYYDREGKIWLPLSNRELLLAGLFLYWGEGGKNHPNIVSINNTDPQALQFALFWLVSGLAIPKRNIHVNLQLYQDMNIQKEIVYWSKVLRMPKKYFDKPYIKPSKRIAIDHKGFGHGTCGLRVYNTDLKQRILAGIKAIADRCSAQIIEL